MSAKMVLREARESKIAKKSLKTARVAVQHVEKSLKEAVAAAEEPFSMGIEVPPADEASVNVKRSDASAEKVSALLDCVRSFMKEKVAECEQFIESVKETTTAEYTGLFKQASAAEKQLFQFKKDIDSRRRMWHQNEVREAVAGIEADVEQMETRWSPLGSVDRALLGTACRQLLDMEKETMAKIEEAKTLIKSRRRASRRYTAHCKALSKQRDRLTDLQDNITKVKIMAANRLTAEGRAMAKDSMLFSWLKTRISVQ